MSIEWKKYDENFDLEPKWANNFIYEVVFCVPLIMYRIPGMSGTARLMLRFASVKSPTKYPVMIAITISHPPALGDFHPNAKPMKTNGIIIKAMFSHSE